MQPAIEKEPICLQKALKTLHNNWENPKGLSLPHSDTAPHYVAAQYGSRREMNYYAALETLLFLWLATFLISCQAASDNIPAGLWPETPQFHLTPRQIDSPQGKPLSGFSIGTTVVGQSPDPLSAYRWEDSFLGKTSQLYHLLPVKWHTGTPSVFGNLRSLTGSKASVSVKGPASLVFDFGVESEGWFEMESPDLMDEIQIDLGESPLFEGVNSPNTRPIKMEHRDALWRASFTETAIQSARFARLRVAKCSKPWHITAVRFVAKAMPVNYEASFDCSDPLLTRIWYCGVYSARLNFEQGRIQSFISTPNGVQHWQAGAYMAESLALGVFNEWDLVRHNLKHASTEANSIECDSLYWVLSLLDYYKHTGDRATLTQYAGEGLARVTHAFQIISTKGNPGFYGWDETLGVGYENPNTPEAFRSFEMLWIRSTLSLAAAFHTVGLQSQIEDQRQKAITRIEQLRKKQRWWQDYGLHASAAAVNAGFVTESERDLIYENRFASRTGRISISPMHQVLLLEALAGMGRYDEALDAVHDCFGAQVQHGSTTFFEAFHPGWNRALPPLSLPNGSWGFTHLNNPGGAGVSRWLTEVVLGIQALRPGYAEYSVCPHPGHSLKRVSGSVRTPQGTLTMDYDFAAGHASIDAPLRTQGRIGVPKLGRNLAHITFDGNPVWPKPAKIDFEIAFSKVSEDRDFIYFSGVEPGVHQLQFTYSGPQRTVASEPLHFSEEFYRLDEATEGHWQGKYGRQGYALFCAGPENCHLVELPAYIDAIQEFACQKGSWKLIGGTNQALQLPSASEEVKKMGYLSTGNPVPGKQSFHVDVTFKTPRSCYIALYLVAPQEAEPSRTGIEVFDLRTLQMQTPLTVVESQGRGRYVIFHVSDSVRFRIYHIQGSQAYLNGMFFDEPLVTARFYHWPKPCRKEEMPQGQSWNDCHILIPWMQWMLVMGTRL